MGDSLETASFLCPMDGWVAVDLSLDRRPSGEELVDDIKSSLTDAVRSAQARSKPETSFRSYADRSPIPAASMID